MEEKLSRFQIIYLKSLQLFRISNIEKLKLRLHGYTSTTPILLDDYKLVYFPIPKAATQALKTYFKSLTGIKSASPHSAFFNFIQPADLVSQPKYHEYFKFTFVRNPWSRLVSSFETKLPYVDLNVPLYRKAQVPRLNRKYPVMNPNMTFAEFIEAISATPDPYLDKHLTSQSKYLTDDSGNLLVDYIGKVEFFNEDFGKVINLANISENIAPVPCIRKTKMGSKSLSRLPYRQYYDRHLWNLVGERFKQDIELFGYEYLKFDP
jgi:chondroitin 4-sulfotransferase 11